MESYRSLMTSLKSGSFSCGKSSRKTYFWLQNGPTQFHPDGNLFSLVYFWNRFPEISVTLKLESPLKLISRNHWYIEIKVTEKVDFSILLILRNESPQKRWFPEKTIRSKNSFISVQTIAFTSISTRGVCASSIAIAVVSTNQTFVDIFAFSSRKL